jgi:DNA-binding transcriptional ArsR family regulator
MINMHEQPIFAALADPMRRKLLVNLAEESPKTATQLAEEYHTITRQGILKHLHILEEAGLVKIQQKGREKRYSLTPEPLNELDEWIKALNAKWDARLLRLKNFLESEIADE